MQLSNLRYSKGSRKDRKRVGRGPGSGHGKTACRGHKGQKSRSGGSIPAWFEGGQMPLQRRVPKRGFTNIFRKESQIVNLADFDGRITGEMVNPEALKEAGLIKNLNKPVKILGNGESLKKAYEVHAHAFSKSAIEKIEKAGGKAITL
ncbi:MAG: 50S ribosomal protein L15 [Deferribacteres bacterium]|nr:50S ribosomal protein L15 [candidate division KSB1 bacterium]MCB9511366.1 50S ribosomal protein L15 [Deferribacteres bacterium]